MTGDEFPMLARDFTSKNGALAGSCGFEFDIKHRPNI